MPIPNDLLPLQDFLQADPPPTLAVAVGARVQTAHTFQRLNLHEDVAKSLRRIPGRLVHDLRNTTIRPFQVGYNPDPHEILSLPIGNDDNVRSTLQSLASINNLALFEAEENIVTHLIFYVLATEDADGNRALFFKRTSPRMELGRRYPYAVIFHGGTYDKVEEKVLLFDETIDCFTWGDSIYIRSVSQFNVIFNFFQQLRTRASQTIDQVLARIPIKNADEFRSACTGQIQMIAKLASIRDKPYLQTLSMESVKQVANDFNVPVTIETDADGSEALVFEPQPERRWLILKLLDDDYLSSPMTTLKYEVNSKSSVG